MTVQPTQSVNFGPSRAITRAAIGAVTIIANPPGAIHSPASSMDRPSPYPVEVGSSRICGPTSDSANIANPTETDARFVVSTGSRAVVRRSPIGDGERSSHHPNSTKITADAENMASVVALVQPQPAPFEMPSSRVISPAASPSAPTGSNRSRATGGTCGTSVVNTTIAVRPSAAENQNSMCQSKFCAMNADNGSPSAPPTPSEELIIAIADPTRSGGTHARMTLMPSGMIGSPNPCRPRPSTSGSSDVEVAAMSEPTVSSAAHAISSRFGPYMSPSRPNIGVATQAVIKVAVMTHEALVGLVFSSRGSSGISGMTKVCINDTQMPAADRAAMRSPGRRTTGSLPLRLPI